MKRRTFTRLALLGMRAGLRAATVPPPMDTPRDIPHTRMKATATTHRMEYTSPEKAIDGNLESGWLSEVGALKKKGPQSLDLDLDAEYTVDAVRYFLAAKPGAALSATSHSRIQKYQVQVSSDGKEYLTVASGEWKKEDANEQRVAFNPVKARFVRLVCLSAGSDTAGVTEISLESPNPPGPVGIKVEPPKDADARRRAFAQRNSPAQQKEIATSIYRLVNRGNPELKGFRALYEKGEHGAALRSFSKALIDRCKEMRDLTLAPSPGISVQAPFGISSEMMANIISSAHLKPKFDVGEPGAINWDSPLLTDELKRTGATVITTDAFEPLLLHYQRTGDSRFLAKWGTYLDDMAMFYPGYSAAISFDIADHDSHGMHGVQEVLAEITRTELERPGFNDNLPETTLPRLLLKILPEYQAISATYFHANAQNWTPEAAVQTIRMGLILDDVIVQDVPLVEQGRRCLERYEALSNLPDGAEAEQAMWYNWGYPQHLFDGLDDIEKVRVHPSQITAEWIAERWENTLTRLLFCCQIFTPQGQWPLFLRGDPRPLYGMSSISASAAAQANWSPLFRSRTVLEDPWIQPVLATIGPDRKPGGSLPFTSNYFPWGGYRVLGEGWNPGSQYASMFSSPVPGKYWARGGADQLNLGTNAFGRDLLTDDAKGHYSPFSSPVMVDGKNQCYRAGYPRWGHKQVLLNGWKHPDSSRWLSSDTFDFMEGTYSGAYGQHGKSQPADIIQENKEAIRGVTHQRQVIFVRQAGLWIATDRLTADRPHDYTWRWILPCRGKKESFFAFLPQEISINDAEKSIVTAKADGENLTLRTFCSGTMNFKRTDRASTAESGNPWNKVSEITGTVKGQRHLLAVTPILPRKTMQDDLKSVSPVQTDNSQGFAAVTPDGSRVFYDAARKGSAALRAGVAKAEAESLLMVDKDGKTSGLVLGCRSLAVNLAAVQLQGEDFTFELRGEKVVATAPIPRPIEMVEIQPARTVFVGEETIRMSCPTSGAEIRYTTNGKEPRRDSILYTKPFRISDSTRIKAKAFRPGLKEAACELNFTHASPETLAVFTRETPAVPGKVGATRTGLNYSYYEGNWQKLMLNASLLEPDGKGVVPAAMDISPRKTKGRFTFVYEGYLDVPAEGVYTFHAPPEFTDNKIDNGYDLVLWIDGQRWYPSTRRHAFGNWSVALARGKHMLRLKYLDYRGDRVDLRLPESPGLSNLIEIDYTRKGPAPRNFPGVNGDYVWGGGVPELLISGPGVDQRAIPAIWLRH